jgi:hypothetical protein
MHETQHGRKFTQGVPSFHVAKCVCMHNARWIIKRHICARHVRMCRHMLHKSGYFPATCMHCVCEECACTRRTELLRHTCARHVRMCWCMVHESGLLTAWILFFPANVCDAHCMMMCWLWKPRRASTISRVLQFYLRNIGETLCLQVPGLLIARMNAGMCGNW